MPLIYDLRYLLELGDTIHATDPCYHRGTWCAQFDVKIKPGEYIAFIELSDEGDWGIRVSSLEIRHRDYTRSVVIADPPLEAGVDSGQFGFFDTGIYPEELEEFERFYDKVCDITLAAYAGTIWDLWRPRGIAVRSGYGDGGYPLHVLRNEDGEVVGLHVQFIDDDGEDEED
jgi:hypothetical protein